MHRNEFAAVMAFIEAGCGKSLSADAAEVYFELLGDLPLPVLQAAAKQALIENTFPVFPTVGTLRKLATASLCRAQDKPLPIEAWEMAMRAVQRFGLSGEKAALNRLPAQVADTARAIGWRSLCDATSLETIRAQFTKAYETIVARDQNAAMIPAPLRKMIESFGKTDDFVPKAIDFRSSAEVLKGVS